MHACLSNPFSRVSNDNKTPFNIPKKHEADIIYNYNSHYPCTRIAIRRAATPRELSVSLSIMWRERGP